MWCETAACERPTACLDVAGTEALLVASDEVAAGPALRLQELEDPEPRRIAEGLEAGDRVFRNRHINESSAIDSGCQAPNNASETT